MSASRTLLEVLAVLVLGFLGLVAGSATGLIFVSPITGIVASLLGATWFLRREGITWRDLGFARAMAPGRLLAYTLGTLAVVYVVTNYLVTPVVRALGAPALDVSALENAIRGDWANYLIFLLPVSWGSAAFGEELIARGFLLHRFAGIAGRHLAVVLQAAFFAGAHAYQGVTGMANIFALAIIFGYAYYASGRNLWPVIAAHGLIDTVGITLLYLGRADLLTGSA